MRINLLKLRIARGMIGMPVCYILALPLMPYKDVEKQRAYMREYQRRQRELLKKLKEKNCFVPKESEEEK